MKETYEGFTIDIHWNIFMGEIMSLHISAEAENGFKLVDIDASRYDSLNDIASLVKFRIDSFGKKGQNEA